MNWAACDGPAQAEKITSWQPKTALPGTLQLRNQVLQLVCYGSEKEPTCTIVAVEQLPPGSQGCTSSLSLSNTHCLL